jgi:hypothetical protein
VRLAHEVIVWIDDQEGRMHLIDCCRHRVPSRAVV